MVEFKTLSYEAVTVGEEFKSDDYLVKPEDVETRVTVEVWCENQDGVMTMVGTASGLESGLRR